MKATAKQRAALGTICDTFVPGDGLTLPSATEIGAVDTVFELLGRNPRESEGKLLAMLLDIWDSPVTGLLTGRGPRRFSKLSQAERERALLRLGDSGIGAVRAVFQALEQASLLAYNVTPGPTGFHPLWKEIGYPGPPGPLPTAPQPALSPQRITEPGTLTCDVVIVGSGAGGGTAAAVLAAAGLDVIVVERGGYYDDKDFGAGELAGLQQLYAPGPSASAEGQITLVAGTCLGGGTVVNWSTSLPTPDGVRDEWAEVGAHQFREAEFTESLDAVVRRLGVNERRGSHAEFSAAARAAGYGPGQCALGALHIMGSARMGGSPELSATDPDGATWEVKNVVVADASCFPTSSGVNPMVSIEAIAHMNAKRLAARLT